MAQADGVVSNGTGSAVRSDINNQYAALWSNHSGSTEPSSGKVAYQFWADTNTNILKIRNSANNSWINLFTLAGGIDVEAASNFNEDVVFEGASSKNAVWDKSDGALEFADNAKATFGSGDLTITHDGSHSYIDESGTGDLKIRSNGNGVILGKTDGENTARFLTDGAVELYYDNSKKFETTTNGPAVSSQGSDDSKLYFLTSGHTTTRIGYVGLGQFGMDVNGGVQIRDAGNSYETMFVASPNGAVELYFDGTKKSYTYSEGWKVNGYIKALADVSDSHYGDGTEDFHTLQSSNETASTLFLEHSGNSTPRGIYAYFSDAAPDNSTQYFLYCEDNSAIRAKINSNGSFESADNSYGGISDIKLKENIVDAKSQWDDVKALKVRNFNFKTEPDTKLLGVVAQEVETISPGIVYESEDLEKGGASKGTTTKGVKYSILYMKAIKALQEAMTRIETLETKVAALESA